MPASTNFLVFNEANDAARTYNDSEYENATQRQIGVIPGMAISRMHNKMYFQWSSMAKAIADFIVSKGYDAIDDDTAGMTAALESIIAAASSDLGYLLRQNNTEYDVGDIAFSANLPSSIVLQCTTAGTTEATEPSFSGAVIGGTVTDGSAVWTYHKLVTSENPTGTIISYAGNGALPEGYLLCDGSALSRATYADLFAAIGTAYGDGDGSTTFNLPDIEDRFLQGASTTNPVGTYKSAGLPDITGALNISIASAAAYSASRVGTSAGTGALKKSLYSTSNNLNSGNASQYTGISISASDSNAIYGNSNTVQPPAVCVRFLIKYQ